jgi:hypothetical protein
MTAEQLIADIQKACNGNLRREIKFSAMIEIGVNASVSDWHKEASIEFASCDITSDHPLKISLNLN